MKFLVICALIVAVQAAHLPSGIKYCKHSDPNYQQCVTQAATEALSILSNGNKEFGLPKLNPIFLKKIEIHSKGGSVNLEQTYTDVNVHGLGTAKFTKFDYKIDDDNCEIHFELQSPLVEVIGPYTASGQILVLALKGHGEGKITLTNLKATIDGTCELKDNHLNIKDLKLKMDPENMQLEADNLVEGNAQLSAEVLKVMNENWADVYREVRTDYEATFAEIFKQLSNLILNKVAFDEVFPK